MFLHFLVASQHSSDEFVVGFGLILRVVRLCGARFISAGKMYPTLTLMAVQTQKQDLNSADWSGNMF